MKTTTKTEAINSCKNVLRNNFDVKRLYHIDIVVVNSNMVRVSAVHDGKYKSVTETFGDI